MIRVTLRLEEARRAYREALEAARSEPSPEAWARLLAAGKDLTAAETPPSRKRRGQKKRKGDEMENLEGID